MLTELTDKIKALPPEGFVFLIVLLPAAAILIGVYKHRERCLKVRLIYAITYGMSAVFVGLGAIIHYGVNAIVLALAGFALSGGVELADRFLCSRNE